MQFLEDFVQLGLFIVSPSFSPSAVASAAVAVKLAAAGREGVMAFLFHHPGSFHFSEHWGETVCLGDRSLCDRGRSLIILLQPMVSSNVLLSHEVPHFSYKEKKQVADAWVQMALDIPYTSWEAVMQRKGNISWGK